MVTRFSPLRLSRYARCGTAYIRLERSAQRRLTRKPVMVNRYKKSPLRSLWQSQSGEWLHDSAHYARCGTTYARQERPAQRRFSRVVVFSGIPHSSGLRPSPGGPVRVENCHFSSGFLRGKMTSLRKTEVTYRGFWLKFFLAFLCSKWLNFENWAKKIFSKKKIFPKWHFDQNSVHGFEWKWL